MKVIRLIMPVLLLSGLLSCQSAGGPDPLVPGKDHCESCRMTIVDSRFGGEIVTAKGKLYKFDSIDCLIDYLRKNPEGKKEVFVSDFQLPGTLLKADDAQFIINQNHSAPMGSRFISVNPQSAEANQTLEGPKLKWSEVLSPQ